MKKVANTTDSWFWISVVTSSAILVAFVYLQFSIGVTLSRSQVVSFAGALTFLALVSALVNLFAGFRIKSAKRYITFLLTLILLAVATLSYFAMVFLK